MIAADCKQKVKAFFLRDYFSRMTTGRKQTVIQKKIKKQKRLLTDTIENLHQKFLSETEHQVSYSCFCTLKPFGLWYPQRLIVKPVSAGHMRSYSSWPTPCTSKVCQQQYEAYRQLRENLRKNECLLHVDFSENYSCKYSQEIQAVHFGGSHQQATLHTGVLYTAADQSPATFCSISPSRRHDPPAIEAHLDPVLDMVRERYPLINHLHVFSDGPATQYKQKGNFYLLSKEPFKKWFKDISWNFFEASHGKGAPDGVGGTLERSADTIVCHGEDIPDAEAMFHKLRNMGTSVELFFVAEEDVERKVKEMMDAPMLVPVKGTMKIHQVLSFSPGTIKYRDITCLCQADKGVLDCACYGLKEVSLGEEASPHRSEGPSRPENITKGNIGQWCIINYDGEPYPGIILEVEDDIKVKCMHKNGTNKFYLR